MSSLEVSSSSPLDDDVASKEEARDSEVPQTDVIQSKNTKNSVLNECSTPSVVNNGVVAGDFKDSKVQKEEQDAPSVEDSATVAVNGIRDSEKAEHHSADEQSQLNESRQEASDDEEEEEEEEGEDSIWQSEEEEKSEGSGSESDLEDNADFDDSFETYQQASAKHRLRDPNPKLPETVTTLTTPEGGKVYLVGTAHFSIESQDDVSQTIQATQPDVVMVELCKSRVNILSLDEKTILEESQNMNLGKIRSAIKKNGIVQGVMYLLLLTMSAHLTKELGMAPGGEFRRAFIEAKKVPGCLIHLGDRPIHITLQRAIAALSWWQKIRLAWYILTSREPISKEEVERCKQRDLLEEMLAEMTGEFPALSTVFVKERDVFLAYSLRLAAKPIPSHSSPEGIIPAVVVGVVGMGHVPGIVENWDKVSEEDIIPILKIPEPTLTSRVLRKTVKYSLIGLALWGCYRLLPTSVTTPLTQRPLEWVGRMLHN